MELSVMVKPATITLTAEANTLLLFTKLVELLVERFSLPIKIGDDATKLVGAHSIHGPAGAGKTHVVFYPSDAFLKAAITAVAPDFDFDTI